MSKSYLTWLGIGLLLLISLHLFRAWEANLLFTKGDSWGYYMYLPATFIHHDLPTFTQSLEARATHAHFKPNYELNPVLGLAEAKHIGDGQQVAKYTCGVALLELPAFAVAHLVAKVGGYPADGYSFPYLYALYLSTFLATFIGLFYLRKILLKYVPDGVAALSLGIVALGTNLFYFTVYNAGMSHPYLFALYAFLIYQSIRFHENPKAAQAIGIGLAAGLITMIRPTEIIVLAIPLLMGITSGKRGKERLASAWRHKELYLLAVCCFLLAGVPQLAYWKYVTGEWLFYSYGEEGFDFAHPKIIQGLFSFKNGWLTYTPIMALSLLGIPFLFKKRDFLLPVLVFLPLHLWIIYSWWCWYYINGFGSRPMVEVYPLLAIPLSFFVEYALRERWKAWVLTAVAMLLLGLNFFQTYKSAKGTLLNETGNAAFYFSTFFKSRLSPTDLVTYDSGIWPPQFDQLRKKATLAQEGFEQVEETTQAAYYDSLDAREGKYAYLLTQGAEFAAGHYFPLEQLGMQGGDYLRISLWVKRLHGFPGEWNCSQVVAAMNRADGSTFGWSSVRLDNKPGNEDGMIWSGKDGIWAEVVFWYQIPKWEKGQRAHVFLWNPNGPPIFVDDMEVELWKRR